MNKTFFTMLVSHSDALEKKEISAEEKWQLHRARIDFGKLDISIGQFLPADLDGNLLDEKEYKRFEGKLSDCQAVLQKHSEAKNRVLFSDFEIIEYPEVKSGLTKSITYKGIFNIFWYDSISQSWSPSKGITCLEHVALFTLPLTKQGEKLMTGQQQ